VGIHNEPRQGVARLRMEAASSVSRYSRVDRLTARALFPRMLRSVHPTPRARCVALDRVSFTLFGRCQYTRNSIERENRAENHAHFALSRDTCLRFPPNDIPSRTTRSHCDAGSARIFKNALKHDESRRGATGSRAPLFENALDRGIKTATGYTWGGEREWVYFRFRDAKISRRDDVSRCACQSERRTQVKRAADPSRERVSSRLLVRLRRRSGILGRVAPRLVRSSARADAADRKSGRDEFSSKEPSPARTRRSMSISLFLRCPFATCYNMCTREIFGARLSHI